MAEYASKRWQTSSEHEPVVERAVATPGKRTLVEELYRTGPGADATGTVGKHALVETSAGVPSGAAAGDAAWRPRAPAQPSGEPANAGPPIQRSTRGLPFIQLKVQLASAPGDAPVAPDPAGQALPADVRARMELSLGADFSSVRVHEGAEAAAAGAQAFARGDALHFRPGAYDPHSVAGQELLGHELAHVVQQRAGRASAAQAKGGIVADAGLEAEADAAGAKAARGEPAAIAGSGSATSASSPVVQRKVHLGGKKDPEPVLPLDEAERLRGVYDKRTIDELRERVRIEKPFHHKDWDDAAAAAFRNSRAKVDPTTQDRLWYGKDSAQRNVNPDVGGPAGPGQFRESAESRELADKLLAKLAELAEAGKRGKKDTLGKGAEGEWKEAIMVGVMITVLGKRYAAKSGAMTDGFRQAAAALGLNVVNRDDDQIIGFQTGSDRDDDPVAKIVKSRQPEQSAVEVGQAPGKCALPKLISQVAASKNDTPAAATEKLFSPDEATNVMVKGVGGEVAKHGNGCSVPSCITCRMLTPVQLEGAPTRDEVMDHAEQGYVKELDRQSGIKNDLAKEAEAAERRRLRNRRKQKKDVEATTVVEGVREKTDRATTWKSIHERVEDTREQIKLILATAPAKLEAANQQAQAAATKTMGAWAKGPVLGASKSPTTSNEPLVAKALWGDEIVPAIKALQSELQVDYKVPPILVPALPEATVEGIRRHADAGLAVIEDAARSNVARKYGALL